MLADSLQTQRHSLVIRKLPKSIALRTECRIRIYAGELDTARLIEGSSVSKVSSHCRIRRTIRFCFITMPKLSVRPNISYNTPPTTSKDSANQLTKASEASLGIYGKTHSEIKRDGTEGMRVPSARSEPSVPEGGSLKSQGYNVYVLERKASPPRSARRFSRTRYFLRPHYEVSSTNQF
jgi:hypothetical protein